MGMSLSARRRACWLLLIALLYAALMPSLGLASGKAAAARTVLLQLCGGDGHTSLSLDLPDESPQAGAGKILAGLCLLCAHPAVPPQLGDGPALAPAVGFAPSRVTQALPPRQADAWDPGLARAPPLTA